ncbi:MAG TPA: OmpH family outer membrane protein [Bryobacteraceae bacterium]|jgi:outer membrane protein
MKLTALSLVGLVAIVNGPVVAQTAQKIAVINIQQAIVETRDGQKARADLQSKFNPTQKDLQDKQTKLAALQDQYRKGQNTLSDEAKQKLARDIDAATTSLKRDTEDANSEVQDAERKVFDELGGKMMAVLNKYATDNGYVLVIDVSNPQTPVLFASNTIDITRDIIGLYDKNAGAMPATSAPKSAVPSPAAPRPPVTAPPKTAPPTK